MGLIATITGMMVANYTGAAAGIWLGNAASGL